MHSRHVQPPAAELLALLQDQLLDRGPLPVEELWRRYDNLGARQLRDGLRMLIESRQLSMRIEDCGPVLFLNQQQSH